MGMKIIKIILSKKEWAVIGRKVGWLKKQADTPVDAPVKTPVRTPTPSKPTTPPTRDPFKPPRPIVLPKPKARIKNKPENLTLSTLKSFENLIKCAQYYERESHPSIRNFWGNIPKEHPFSEHPILSKYGPKLSEEGFGFSRSKLTEKGQEAPSKAMRILAEVQSLLPKIFELEATHEGELIEMAKDITAQIWGIDKSTIEGQINPEVGPMGMEEEKEEINLVEVTPLLKEEINKRITINTLTQGASVHSMSSVHHMVAEKLRQISPELLDLYTRMSGLITHHYYTLDIPSIIQAVENLSQAGAGWEKVEWPEEAEGAEGTEGVEGIEGVEAKPKIIAKGICFPVLCQEMFKGVMELLSFHGLPQNLSADELNTIYHYADRLEDEPYQITAGPALWRKLLSIMPKDISLSEFIMKLNGKSPQEMHEIVSNVIENPQVAKEMVQDLVVPEVKEQYVNEDEKPAGELVVPPETFEGLEDIFEKPQKEISKEKPKPKQKKDKGAGEIVVPKETFDGLEDIFEKNSKPKKRS